MRDKGPAERFLDGLGYRVGEPVFDPEQNVNLIMCHHDKQPAVEVIYPAKGPSPVDGLMARHSDGLIYHACYVSENLEASLSALDDARLRAVCVAPPKPAVLFGGSPVSFYQLVGMGVIEIIEGPIPPGFPA
ncbi:MAG: VOC family protein [Methylobacteriaceae bacterium]|nr:VOC family protein [Methylobacteriaceae bacterium]